MLKCSKVASFTVLNLKWHDIWECQDCSSAWALVAIFCSVRIVSFPISLKITTTKFLICFPVLGDILSSKDCWPLYSSFIEYLLCSRHCKGAQKLILISRVSQSSYVIFKLLLRIGCTYFRIQFCCTVLKLEVCSEAHQAN